MKKKICCLICVLTVLCMAAVTSGCSGGSAVEADGSSAEETAAEFNDLKEFTAVTSAEEKITQSYFADYDVTIIHIWATFCPPCLEEMEKIAELDAARPDNIGLLLICTDGLKESDYMQEILDESGFKGINLVKGKGDFAKLTDSVEFVPTTVFADSEGNLVGIPVIGESANPKMTYLKHANDYLKEQGVDPIDY